MRVAMVTGGGRGIGRAIALALGGPDTLVAVGGRTQSQLESTARDIEALVDAAPTAPALFSTPIGAFV